MTEAIDWFKVRMWELKKLLRGSDYNTIYDESGAKVVGDLTEWLKMKGAAKFQNNLNPVVAITKNDDVVFLQDFEEAPTDRSKAIIHFDGLYEFIKGKVNQDGQIPSNWDAEHHPEKGVCCRLAALLSTNAYARPVGKRKKVPT
ncbi:MAG: hypothetical protein ACXW1O_04510 [Halobacteriota archaeon]